MPKPYTSYTFFDEVKSLSVADLKKGGYLQLNQWQEGTVTWHCRNIQTGNIRITVNTVAPEPYVELNYFFKGKPIQYTIRLVTVPSNLGKGIIWYFLCPITHKRCRILYSMGELFLHRHACKGYLYEVQAYPKAHRKLFCNLRKLFTLKKQYPQLFKKYSKRIYAGKPTKRFKHLTQNLRTAL